MLLQIIQLLKMDLATTLCLSKDFLLLVGLLVTTLGTVRHRHWILFNLPQPSK